MSEHSPCPACGDAETRSFLRIGDVPANSCIQLYSREQALCYPRGSLDLGLCPGCGYLWNQAFDPALAEYSGRYEETQGCSPTFNAFHRDLAERLIRRFDLHGKTIVEIGCGKGEFLALLSELGNNRGIGIDPGSDPARLQGQAVNRVTLLPEFYDRRHRRLRCDLLCCKMTLEHIHRPAELLATIRDNLQGDGEIPVFFMVPDAGRIIRDCAFEDLYYEHCAYYTPGALCRLFRSQGFSVLELGTEYGGQYLTLYARLADEAAVTAVDCPDEQSWLPAGIDRFRERYARIQRDWQRRLGQWREEGRPVVVWGAGSKSLAFIQALGTADGIACLVDINPRRQGTFQAGTGLPIVAPEYLMRLRPAVVIAMNPVYRQEIAEALRAMGLSPELRCL